MSQHVESSLPPFHLSVHTYHNRRRGFLGRKLATAAVRSVHQDDVGSKGPTAMVFMNMGGPSTTEDVGDFLSRLFVFRRQLRY